MGTIKDLYDIGWDIFGKLKPKELEHKMISTDNTHLIDIVAQFNSINSDLVKQINRENKNIIDQTNKVIKLQGECLSRLHNCVIFMTQEDDSNKEIAKAMRESALSDVREMLKELGAEVINERRD